MSPSQLLAPWEPTVLPCASLQIIGLTYLRILPHDPVGGPAQSQHRRIDGFALLNTDMAEMTDRKHAASYPDYRDLTN